MRGPGNVPGPFAVMGGDSAQKQAIRLQAERFYAAKTESEALTAERNEVSGRVSDILAVLTAGVQAPKEEAPDETPRPKRPVLPSPFPDALLQ